VPPDGSPITIPLLVSRCTLQSVGCCDRVGPLPGGRANGERTLELLASASGDQGESIPRKKLPRAQREQQLLDVSEELFLEHGYLETSIDDIARAAGVSRPIVYDHFGNKEGVYLGCVRRARRAYEAATAAAHDPSVPVREQFLRGAIVYFEMLAKDPRRWELLFARTGLISDSLAADLTEERHHTIAIVSRNFAAASPEVDPIIVESAAYAVSGAAEQLGRWWLRHPEVSLEQVAQLHVSFAWNALRGAFREELARSSDAVDRLE